MDPDEVIMSPARARERGLTSTVTFPRGNLAPEGSVIKSTAIDPSVVDPDGVYRKTGPARVFTRERDAIVVVAPSTQPTQGLGVLGIKAPEMEPGFLTSGNTRRAGYVLLADLTPTIAELAGVELDEASIEGRTVERRDGPATGAARRADLVDAEAAAQFRDRVLDPVDTLTALGSADLAATTGYLARAAERGVPVLLDGLMSVACALTADRLAPGAAAWFAAGHRSTEPAQTLALAKLGLEPVLDLGLRLGEGSGAVTAVPVLRSAVAVLRDVALLADLLPPQ